MASYEQRFYCKNCKKYVSVKNNKCSICDGNSISKSWTVRFRYIGLNGIEQQKRLTGFQTRKEAEKKYGEFSTENQEYRKQAVTDMTIDNLFTEYYESQKGSLKESTLYSLEKKYNKHIKPYFGHLAVLKTNKAMIIEWLNKLQKEYKFNTVSNTKICFKALYKHFNYVYDNSYNPFLNIKPLKNLERKEEMQIWTSEEFNEFIKHVDNLSLKCFFCTLYLTGMRKGEAEALLWKDIDFKKATININKSITHKVLDKTKINTTYQVTTTKNLSSDRKITMTDNLSTLLKQLKESSSFTGDNDYVFQRDGEPISDKLPNSTINAICKDFDIKRIRVHDLRHSHASYLLSQGVSIVDVSKRLGHKNITQTLDTYSHSMPKQQELLLKKLGDIKI